jgi:dolichyl-phosphate beta-glucosyltransferase
MGDSEARHFRTDAASNTTDLAGRPRPIIPFPGSAETECSLVIPAYREAKRLPRFLDSVRQYFSQQYKSRYEVVVVDDGSDDGLLGVLLEMQADWPELRTLRHSVNCGKGAAVRSGMLRACGKVLLFADADGATPIGEEQKLRAAIDAGADIAIGSRHLKSNQVQRKRKWTRRAGSWLFHHLVHAYVDVPVCDTQCGFKMFRRDAAMRLFALCDETGYLFDVYLLRLAVRLGYSISEVDVNWQDVAGSKLNLANEFCRMWRQLSRLENRVDNILARDADSRPGLPQEPERRPARKIA